MNDSDHGDEIVRLEAQIDELAATVESCRKFIVAGRIAVAGGGVVLVAMVIGAIRLDPSVMAGAVAAVLAGIVAAGSNRSTAKEATHELAAAEAKRAVAFIRNRFPRTIAYLARDRMMLPGVRGAALCWPRPAKTISERFPRVRRGQ